MLESRESIWWRLCTLLGTTCTLTINSYLFNPYSLATCVARSTTALDNLVALCAIASACQGSVHCVIG